MNKEQIAVANKLVDLFVNNPGKIEIEYVSISDWRRSEEGSIKGTTAIRLGGRAKLFVFESELDLPIKLEVAIEQANFILGNISDERAHEARSPNAFNALKAMVDYAIKF